MHFFAFPGCDHSHLHLGADQLIRGWPDGRFDGLSLHFAVDASTTAVAPIRLTDALFLTDGFGPAATASAYLLGHVGGKVSHGRSPIAVASSACTLQHKMSGLATVVSNWTDHIVKAGGANKTALRPIATTITTEADIGTLPFFYHTPCGIVVEGGNARFPCTSQTIFVSCSSLITPSVEGTIIAFRPPSFRPSRFGDNGTYLLPLPSQASYIVVFSTSLPRSMDL